MAAKMTPAGLERYDGVVFASTTGALPLPNREAFLKWIAEGHAFIGVHAASDTFHGFPPYLEMLGGEFRTHGPQVWVVCNVEDRDHPATRGMGASRLVFDEIYQFDRFDRSKVHMLLSLDHHPNEGTPGYFPIAWCKMYGKGRVFYTALGHRPDVWESSVFQQHLLGGIRWALGEENGDATPQQRSSQTKDPIESKTNGK
jgi:type 1 glutamine amidotransferase